MKDDKVLWSVSGEYCLNPSICSGEFAYRGSKCEVLSESYNLPPLAFSDSEFSSIWLSPEARALGIYTECDRRWVAAAMTGPPSSSNTGAIL